MLKFPRGAHVLILFVISSKFLFCTPLFGILYISHVFGVEIEWPHGLCPVQWFVWVKCLPLCILLRNWSI
jgi:hypothetical protein